MHNFNLITFAYINGAAGTSPVLDWSILFLTNDLVYIICALVALYMMLWYPLRYSRGVEEMIHSFRHGAEFVLAIALTWVAVYALKLIVALPRPFATLHHINVLSPLESGYSFPSGHAALTVAIATSVYFYHRRLGVLLYFFALLIGISRIYVGVHYPSDVVVGSLLGFAISSLVHIGLEANLRAHTAPRQGVALKPKKG